MVPSRKKPPSGKFSEKAWSVGSNKEFPVKVKKLFVGQRTERWLCCESPAKAAKAGAMKAAFQRRFECDLQIAAAALSKPKGTKSFQKVVEKIGRIKEKHCKISSCYQVEVIPSEDGKKSKRNSLESN